MDLALGDVLETSTHAARIIRPRPAVRCLTKDRSHEGSEWIPARAWTHPAPGESAPDAAIWQEMRGRRERDFIIVSFREPSDTPRRSRRGVALRLACICAIT